MARIAVLFSLAASVISGDPPEPCYAQVDGSSPFEEVCYSPLVELPNGFTLRDYSGDNALATLYHLHAPAAFGPYDYALNETTVALLNYFLGPGNAAGAAQFNLLTVPLLLRPPTAADPRWIASMALAPSQFPVGSVPVPVAKGSPYNQTLELLGRAGASVVMAVQHARRATLPGQKQFDALCSTLEKNLAALAIPIWAVDTESQYTPMHARYWGRDFPGPYDYECWMAVVKTTVEVALRDAQPS